MANRVLYERPSCCRTQRPSVFEPELTAKKGMLRTYLNLILVCLQICKTSITTAQADAPLWRYTQSQMFSPTHFAKALLTKSHRCVEVYDEKSLRKVFHKGMQEALSHIMRNACSTNTSAGLINLARHATSDFAIQKRANIGLDKEFWNLRVLINHQDRRGNSLGIVNVDKRGSTTPKVTDMQPKHPSVVAIIVVTFQLPPNRLQRDRRGTVRPTSTKPFSAWSVWRNCNVKHSALSYWFIFVEHFQRKKWQDRKKWRPKWQTNLGYQHASVLK